MRHNILTVANEDYRSFLILFVNSLFEFGNLSETEKIYVFDTGLSQETRDYLLCFPKIEIRNAGFTAQSDAIHDSGWKRNTYSKTKFLKDILISNGVQQELVEGLCAVEGEQVNYIPMKK